MTTRQEYRQHAGRAIGRDYYASSTTTTASPDASTIVDVARTEHDTFWNGATLRISSQDRLVRGGAGANTGRSPTLTLDRDLTSTPSISTNYEIVKAFSFTDFDEALDDSLGNLWPYFFDPIDDTSTLTVANTIEYALDANWREIYRVQMQLDTTTTPSRFRDLVPGQHYEIYTDPANMRLHLYNTPQPSLALRIFARAIPSISSNDASTSIHPHHVVVPGMLAYLYRKGANADAGALSQRWEAKAAQAQAVYERRRTVFHQPREAYLPKTTSILVGS